MNNYLLITLFQSAALTFCAQLLIAAPHSGTSTSGYLDVRITSDTIAANNSYARMFEEELFKYATCECSEKALLDINMKKSVPKYFTLQSYRDEATLLYNKTRSLFTSRCVFMIEYDLSSTYMTIGYESRSWLSLIEQHARQDNWYRPIDNILKNSPRNLVKKMNPTKNEDLYRLLVNDISMEKNNLVKAFKSLALVGRNWSLSIFIS